MRKVSYGMDLTDVRPMSFRYPWWDANPTALARRERAGPGAAAEAGGRHRGWGVGRSGRRARRRAGTAKVGGRLGRWGQRADEARPAREGGLSRSAQKRVRGSRDVRQKGPQSVGGCERGAGDGGRPAERSGRSRGRRPSRRPDFPEPLPERITRKCSSRKPLSFLYLLARATGLEPATTGSTAQ